jgi:hypothetical protein
MWPAQLLHRNSTCMGTATDTDSTSFGHQRTELLAESTIEAGRGAAHK